MKRLALIFSLLANPALAQERVVSLDYCADQYVMALADRGDIRAVSPAAGSEYSYFAARADGLRRLRPTGEEVLLAAPDLVVRQWGGGFNAAGHLAQFDIPVAQVDFGTDIETARRNLRTIGRALGKAAEADALIAEMDARLRNIEAVRAPRSVRPRAFYVTPGGVTAGRGTFVDEAMRAAGLVNMAGEAGLLGWGEMSLEALALDPPDLFVGAFFDLEPEQVNFWSLARHSFLRQIMAETPTVFVPGRELACSAWFFVDAVEKMAEAARELRIQAVASRE